MQLIARTHRQWPPEFVEAGPDDASGGLQLAFDQQTHGERGGVPAACGESLEERATRSLLVKVERLRVERGGERLDLGRVDRQPP